MIDSKEKGKLCKAIEALKAIFRQCEELDAFDWKKMEWPDGGKFDVCSFGNTIAQIVKLDNVRARQINITWEE